LILLGSLVVKQNCIAAFDLIASLDHNFIVGNVEDIVQAEDDFELHI